MSSVLIAPALDQDISIIPSERGFAALRDAYRATGGIADGDDLARLLEERQLGRYMSLARLIVLGGVFSFEWRGSRCSSLVCRTCRSSRARVRC